MAITDLSAVIRVKAAMSSPISRQGGETAVLRDEKITAVKSTEAARRAALFRAMQACSASAPVCAAYRMRNSPVKVPGRNRSLAFSLVGVPWWSL